jgi:hypothetical protein
MANGGFIYMQNAQPNGPAVWLFTEVMISAVMLWPETKESIAYL